MKRKSPKPFTEEHKGNIAKNNARFWFGKTRSKETNDKISKTLKGRIISDTVKKNMSKALIGNTHTLGHTLTDSHKRKISEWQVTNPNKKFKDTGIELKIEAELIRRGVNYQKQVPLCKIARVDFYLPEYRIVIQCDGCYYHCCPIHYPNFYKDKKERDVKQDAVLTFNGFNVYRFWEHEINESVENCINKIKLK